MATPAVVVELTIGLASLVMPGRSVMRRTFRRLRWRLTRMMPVRDRGAGGAGLVGTVVTFLRRFGPSCGRLGSPRKITGFLLWKDLHYGRTWCWYAPYAPGRPCAAWVDSPMVMLEPPHTLFTLRLILYGHSTYSGSTTR